MKEYSNRAVIVVCAQTRPGTTLDVISIVPAGRMAGHGAESLDF